MSFIYKDNEYTIKNIDCEYSYFAEQEFLEITAKYIKDNAVIIDIGCNVGNHTIYYSKVLNCKKIYVFEPITKMFNIMMNNFKINNVNNVVPYNIALANKETTLHCISKLPDYNGSFWLWYDNDKNEKHPYERGYAVHKGMTGDEITETIQSKTLDSIMKNTNIDFIKIDVEGMEYEVLKGGINTISKNKPLLQIEIAIDNNHNISKLLSNLNYKRIEQHIFKGENQLWIQQ